MKLPYIFGIGRKKILEKDTFVPAAVTSVTPSRLLVIKKPVRIGITPENTLFSHYIHFTYTAAGISYKGKLFVSANRRCPQAGETIDVYYDPASPEKYACRSFGPAARPIGW